MDHILSWLIWLPVIGWWLLHLYHEIKRDLIKIGAAITTGVQFLLANSLCGVILILIVV